MSTSHVGGRADASDVTKTVENAPMSCMKAGQLLREHTNSWRVTNPDDVVSS
jgi:hypothetical protein